MFLVEESGAFRGEKKSFACRVPFAWTARRTTAIPRSAGGLDPGVGPVSTKPGLPVATNRRFKPSDMIPDPDCQMPAPSERLVIADHRARSVPAVLTPEIQ